MHTTIVTLHSHPGKGVKGQRGGSDGLGLAAQGLLWSSALEGSQRDSAFGRSPHGPCTWDFPAGEQDMPQCRTLSPKLPEAAQP